MSKLVAYINESAMEAKVGWTKDADTAGKRQQQLGEGWKLKLGKREYFNRRSETLLAYYCVLWKRGYRLINRSIPGTSLEKELAMQKLMDNPGELVQHVYELIELLSFDPSCDAVIKGRFYPQ